MTAEMAIRRTNEPTEWTNGNILTCEISYINNENKEDETSFGFEINDIQKYWRDELLSYWEEFRKENNLNENCVTGAWFTLLTYGLSNEKIEKLIKDIKDGNEEIKMNDPVNHPSHYTDGKIEVLDFIEDKKLNYHRGNAVKYICRAGKKDPNKEAEDLEKAVFYLNREIQLLKNKEIQKTGPTYSFNSSTTSEEAAKYIDEWDEIDHKFYEAISLIAKASGANFEQSEYDWDITKEVIEHTISIICPDFKPLDINY